MRRADRLFQIVQLLRVRSVTTGAEIAGELEVSVRTVYRDIQDLIASGVPIEGEAGVGYTLPDDFDLPPLMFTETEIEALVLGARMVEAWGDSKLAREARQVLAKVRDVLPERLEARLDRVGLFAPSFHVPAQLTENLPPFRNAIAERRKLRFSYSNRDGQDSSRTTRPIGLYYWGNAWTAVAWCELRGDFRTFRPDRARDIEDAGPFEDEPGRDLETFLRIVSEQRDR